MDLTAAQARRIAEIAKFGEHVEIQPLDDYGVMVWAHNGVLPQTIGFIEIVERRPTGRVAWDMGLDRPT